MEDSPDVAVLMCVWGGDDADSFEAALLSVLNQYRNLVYMTVLSLATIYLLMLTSSKRSFKRALIAVVMRTIYAANLALGLLLYYPKLPVGIQKSEEYKEMVTKANRHL